MMNIALLAFLMAFNQDAAISHVVTATSDIGKVYACPRCRRAKPPGPRKRPTPPPTRDNNNAK